MLAQLYETLHVGEHQVKKERDLYARLEELHTQLAPMEKVCDGDWRFGATIHNRAYKIN